MPNTAHLGAHALAELHDKARRAGVDPMAIVRTPSPPPVLGPPLRILPFENPSDSSFVDPIQVREPDPPIHREDEEALPAKPATKSMTPNLDTVRGWQAEQLRGDRP